MIQPDFNLLLAVSVVLCVGETQDSSISFLPDHYQVAVTDMFSLPVKTQILQYLYRHAGTRNTLTSSGERCAECK